MNERPQGMNKVMIGLVVVTLLVIAATAVIVVVSGNQVQNPFGTAASTDTYKDGSYDARGSYLTPGGTESIDLTVTLKNNVITSTDITQNAISNEAHQYQGLFASGFKSEVVGKKINDVSLTRVAGSSLTPIGFNNAINDIKNQAKA